MRFGIGDYVRVRRGKFAGRTGFVHHVGSTRVTVRLRRDRRWFHVAYKPEALELAA